jgi:hypothetical protein
VLLGRLVLHEPLPGSVLLAGTCIIGAVMLITKTGKRTAAPLKVSSKQ